MQCCSKVPGDEFSALFAGVLLSASVYASSTVGLQSIELPCVDSDAEFGDGVTRLALLLATAFSMQSVAVFLEVKSHPGQGVVIHRSKVGQQSREWELIYAHPDSEISTVLYLPSDTKVFCLKIYDDNIDLDFVSSSASDLDVRLDWYSSGDAKVIIEALQAHSLFGEKELPRTSDWKARLVMKANTTKIDLFSVVSGELKNAHFVMGNPDEVRFGDWKRTLDTLGIGDTMLTMKALNYNRSELEGEATLTVRALIEAAAAAAQGKNTVGSIIGRRSDGKMDWRTEAMSICNQRTWNPLSWSKSARRNYNDFFGGLLRACMI
jgi:hypothetical protein